MQDVIDFINKHIEQLEKGRMSKSGLESGNPIIQGLYKVDHTWVDTTQGILHNIKTMIETNMRREGGE